MTMYGVECITLTEGKSPQNKQELKALQRITRKDTQRLVMSESHRLQEVINRKGFATKY